MSLEPGLQFTDLDDVPEHSRPEQPEVDLSEPTGRGRHHAARLGADGTRWCASCLTTLLATSNLELCAACKTKANTLRRAAARARAAGEPVVIPRAVFNKLLRGMRAIDLRVGEVTSALAAGASTEDAGRRLARQSALVAHLIRTEVRPLGESAEPR